MEGFEKQIQGFSHRLTLLRLSKNQLAISAEELYSFIASTDKSGKGFLSRQQMKAMWIQTTNVDQESIEKFIIFHFPFEKISYSLFSRFILPNQNLNFVQQNRQKKKFSELNKNIKQIFHLQLLNYLSFCKINQQMGKFIPSVGTKPTKIQFQEYVICKQLVVDIEEVSKALVLPQISKIIPTKSQPNNFPSNLSDPSVQNIQKIMNRLMDKVNCFGNEWLA